MLYYAVDNKPYERELGVFNSINNTIHQILITNETLDFPTSTVRHIKFKDFLKKETLDKTV